MEVYPWDAAVKAELAELRERRRVAALSPTFIAPSFLLPRPGTPQHRRRPVAFKFRARQGVVPQPHAGRTVDEPLAAEWHAT